MKNLILLLLIMVMTIFALGITEAKEGRLASDQDAITATLDDVDIGTNYTETTILDVSINGDSDQTGQMTTTAPAIATKSSLLELMYEIDRSYYTAYPYQALARGGDAAVRRHRPTGSAGTYLSDVLTVNIDHGAMLLI